MNTVVKPRTTWLPSFSLVEFSVVHPRQVLVFIAFVALAFMAAFPFAKTDTNPKNMLPPHSAVRVSNDHVEKQFGLHEDTVVVAVTPKGGVLHPETLEKLRSFNTDLLGVEGVVKRDLISLFTTDNITAYEDTLRICSLTPANLSDPVAITQLRQELFDGTLFIDRLISKDEATTAFYIPLEKGVDAARIAGLGYSREVATDTTFTVQLQTGHDVERSVYLQSLAPGIKPAKAHRFLAHTRLHARLRNQTLEMGIQGFFSNEGDYQVNPFISYAVRDALNIGLGAHLFRGDLETRYGTLQDDSKRVFHDSLFVLINPQREQP